MWCFAKKKSLHKSCRMGRRVVMMKLICSLGHCECDSHTAHKHSQWRLTADWLAPWESDCSRMHSKVSSDWLPSYIKTTWSVFEIFKMDGYCMDSPDTSNVARCLALNQTVWYFNILFGEKNWENSRHMIMYLHLSVVIFECVMWWEPYWCNVMSLRHVGWQHA